ncbi:MAG: hypothetical protein H0V29_01960 [Thermoleophilaceae bacterium]|nr:hypothetical protein [Thermoleophilaceae bacterium]
MTRFFVPFLAVLVTALAVSAAKPASSEAVIVGIGDQNPQTFQDQNFRSLGVKRTRVFTPWNSIFTEPERLDTWIQAARRAGAEPLIAFWKARGDKCPARPCTLPSVKAYTRAFKAFRKKYPGIRLYQPWNETNSNTEPTGKKPKRAAEYYNAMRKSCRRCKVVALDLLDGKNMKKYVSTFKKFVKGKEPTLWGLHNYSDTNRSRTKGTKLLLKLVKGEIWLTETGGLTSFTAADGRQILPASEARATRATSFLLNKLVRIDKRRIKRVYLYQWRKTNANDRFDAGIVRFDGTPRPIFNLLRTKRSLFR